MTTQACINGHLGGCAFLEGGPCSRQLRIERAKERLPSVRAHAENLRAAVRQREAGIGSQLSEFRELLAAAESELAQLEAGAAEVL
jgi:hypothetical protein